MALECSQNGSLKLSVVWVWDKVSYGVMWWSGVVGQGWLVFSIDSIITTPGTSPHNTRQNLLLNNTTQYSLDSVSM